MLSYTCNSSMSHSSKRHSTFGDVERLINKDFVDSMYVKLLLASVHKNTKI